MQKEILTLEKYHFLDITARDSGGWLNLTSYDCSLLKEFGNKIIFGDESKFGDGCIFGNSCKFEEYCKFGNNCEFGNHCNFRKENLYKILLKIIKIT
jgi:NDP-sugar pyrophosphorylase family protein